ncbi:MAG: diguanylate cyclase [Myxococcales bacterium]|nr:MAG: diguanylate cyclase [Myxococcales bacterium]
MPVVTSFALNLVAKIVFRVRSTASTWLGYIAVGLLGAPVGLGAFLPRHRPYGFWHLVYVVAWVAVFLARVMGRFRTSSSVRYSATTSSMAKFRQLFIGSIGADLEIGLLLLVAVQAMVQASGGLGSPLHPLVYVLLAFMAAFADRWVGMSLVLSAFFLELVLYFFTENQTALRPFLLYASFRLFFGLTNWLFTSVEIRRVRQRSKQELATAQAKVLEDARLFRLVTAPAGHEQRDDERLFRSSVDEVKQALFHMLELLQATLNLHTCILLMLDDFEHNLRIVELSTKSDDIVPSPILKAHGVVAAVMEKREPVVLSNLRLGYRGLCYYRGPAEVTDFVGIPVFEGEQLRGVLCADRKNGAAFSQDEITIFAHSVHQILRVLQNERVFVQLEQSKYEQTMLYRASQSLSAALSVNDVVDAAIEATAQISAYDFCAVSTYDRHKRKHLIQRAVGRGSEALQGFSFSDNTSLTAMVVKTGHYLPYRGSFDDKQQTLYTKRKELPNMRSLLVLPLTAQDKTIGTIAVAAAQKNAFSSAIRTTLQVLSTQIATALANAQAVKRLEELATTDGLTGCLNKRTLLGEMEQKVRSAERFDRKLSLVIADLDHFKAINDTYGHAAGDRVIQALGTVLQRVKRETDLVARFGGEEFCLLCEETDTAGAVLLAERVREEIAASVFNTEQGVINVTCSLGVATYPRDARDKEGLFEAADKALYMAKHQGRNRVCAST